MAGEAYDNEQCMFFVGGNDAKANNNSAGQDWAGGCTKAWWLTQLGGLEPGDAGYDAAAIAAMGKLMNVDGTSIAVVEAAVVVDWDDDWVEFYSTGWGAIEAGMIVYITDTDGYAFSTGAGLYTVLAVDGDNVKLTGDSHGLISVDDTADINVGGAFWDIWWPAETISAAAYSQEIFCNMDHIPDPVWDWALGDWGYGDAALNTWLRILGFNRVPCDITDPRGSSYESTKDAEDNGANPSTDSWVNLDLDARATIFIRPDNGENIQISGFRFYNQASDKQVFLKTSASYQNICLMHNAFDCNFASLNFGLGDRIIILDNYFYTTTDVADVGIIAMPTSERIVIGLNRFAFRDLNVILINKLHDVVLFGNHGVGNWMSFQQNVSASSFIIQLHNTWLNSGNGSGAIQIAGGFLLSLANIIMPKIAADPAFDITASGGSILSKNDCLYSEVPEALDDAMINAISGGEADSMEFTLKENPELDANGEPLNENVRQGGLTDIQGDVTTIGAIQTMNTTVIEAAVTAALEALDTEVAAIKAKTDSLNFVGDDIKATLDSELVKLAADGWDGLSIVEPSGDPDGWTVPQKLMWLIMRFMNKHTSDNFDGIKVHKADDTVSTTQSVTEAAGVKTVERAT